MYFYFIFLLNCTLKRKQKALKSMQMCSTFKTKTIQVALTFENKTLRLKSDAEKSLKCSEFCAVTKLYRKMTSTRTSKN